MEQIASHQAPAMPSWPGLGIWPDLWRDPLQFVTRAAAVGGVVRLGTFPEKLYFACSPSAIRQVLVDNASNYWRGSRWRRAKLILGEGLATVDGEDWRRQRARVQPAFHRERIVGGLHVMNVSIDEMFAAWKKIAASGISRDIKHDLVRLTTTVVMQSLFGVDFVPAPDTLSLAIGVAVDGLTRRVMAPWQWPSWLPGSDGTRLRRAVEHLDGIITQIVVRRRAVSCDGDDLLSMLMRARDDNGVCLTDGELRDELMTILTAAIETQVSALTWLLCSLATYPEVSEQVRAEAMSLAGLPPSAADLGKLVYARRVVDETLRLYPSGWIFDRTAKANDMLDGFVIPARSTVFVCPYATHRLPGLWPQPERFDPDRFLPERTASRNAFSYLPFGAGQRTCIGAPLALTLATLLAARACRTFKLGIESRGPLRPRAAALLAAPQSVRLRLVEL